MNDFKVFDLYRKDYTRNHGGEAYCDINYLLRFWEENKGKYLRPLFGDDLILEKEIVYNKPSEVLHHDMNRTIHEYAEFLYKIIDDLKVAMGVTNDWDENDTIMQIAWRGLRASLLNSSCLTDNVLDLGYSDYTENGPKYINAVTIEFENGKKVQVQRGMKTTRAFTQICKALDMSEEWEKFRIAHSQVLNTKKLTGTLCLSIHPMDYATASDNDNGWSSCMSWNDYGCYRMGTVEMMNSPMVICAYLKSNKQHMDVEGGEWNSKKWRAWIIVTKDVILCNRHYPYHQDDMAIQCINWVRELVGEKYGWIYEDPHTDFYAWMRDVGYEMEFYTNYMYNDLGGDDIIGCFKKGWSGFNMPGVINFSGPAECMVCGREIAPECQEASQLECEDCWAEFRCAECGEALREDDVWHDPDGRCLCRNCYERECVECHTCGDTCYREDTTQVTFPIARNQYQKWADIFKKTDPTKVTPNADFEWMLHERYAQVNPVAICDDCVERFYVTDIEFDDNDPNGYAVGMYSTCDPNKVTMHSWLRKIEAPAYDTAEYIMDGINRGRYFGFDDPKATKEYYQHILDFWTEQWNIFTKSFKEAEDLDAE